MKIETQAENILVGMIIVSIIGLLIWIGITPLLNDKQQQTTSTQCGCCCEEKGKAE